MPPSTKCIPRERCADIGICLLPRNTYAEESPTLATNRCVPASFRARRSTVSAPDQAHTSLPGRVRRLAIFVQDRSCQCGTRGEACEERHAGGAAVLPLVVDRLPLAGQTRCGPAWRARAQGRACWQKPRSVSAKMDVRSCRASPTWQHTTHRNWRTVHRRRRGRGHAACVPAL
jgi:hypothetical protein